MLCPKRPLFVLTALALTGALAACSQGQTGDAGGGPAIAGPVVSDPPDAFPLTVKTKLGTVTIDERPQRVVAVGWGDAEAALALGVTPVGVGSRPADDHPYVGPWAQDRLGEDTGTISDPQTLTDDSDPRYAEIEELKPDLILATDLSEDYDQDRYDLLSQIAPVISAPRKPGPGGYPDFIGPTRVIARALGEKASGEALLARLDARFNEVAAAHPEFRGQTVTRAMYTRDGWRAYLEDASQQFTFFERLGFRQNPAVRAAQANAVKQEPALDGAFVVVMPDDDFASLDADLVVLSSTPEISTNWILRAPGYNSLPAVRAGHSMLFTADEKEPYEAAFNAPTVLAQEWLLDTYVPEIVRVLK